MLSFPAGHTSIWILETFNLACQLKFCILYLYSSSVSGGEKHTGIYFSVWKITFETLVVGVECCFVVANNVEKETDTTL